MESVVYEVEPLCNADPPEAAAYQSTVSPAPGVADIVTVPVPHLAAPVPVGAGSEPVIDATTAVLVADTHPPEIFLASA